MLAEAVRSGFIESRHVGSVAVVDANGVLLHEAGDPSQVIYARSTIKPFQALAALLTGGPTRLGLDEEALAIACGSHMGEPMHLAVVERILARGELTSALLQCPPARPRDGLVAAPAPQYHNCSGKHAFALATSRALGWPTATYLSPDHPLQVAVLSTLQRLAGVAVVHLGVDGCGLPAPALPLAALATAGARLLRAAAEQTAPAAVLHALRAHPLLLAGTGELDSLLPELTGGRLLSKVGAEGVYLVLNQERTQALALKVHDGSARAAGPAVLAVLGALGWLSAEEQEGLATTASSVLLGGGSVVGHVRPALVTFSR